MPIVPASCITRVEQRMEKENFTLSNAPYNKKLATILVEEILQEMQKATVTVTGASATGGPVTGTGTIS